MTSGTIKSRRPTTVYLYVEADSKEILADPDHAYEKAVTQFASTWEQHVAKLKAGITP